MDKRFEQTAFFPADILLPQVSEMEKWPVVACDQFTSQPEYWQEVEEAGGLRTHPPVRLFLPESLPGDGPKRGDHIHGGQPTP